MAGVTVRVVEPEIVPEVAVIFVKPAALEVAKPFEPVTLLMVATDSVSELQVTVVVMSCLALFEKIPVAVNCWCVPNAIAGLTGVTSIETRSIGLSPPPPHPQPEAKIVSNNATNQILSGDFICFSPLLNFYIYK